MFERFTDKARKVVILAKATKVRQIVRGHRPGR
jgi:hypothetical protein